MNIAAAWVAWSAICVLAGWGFSAARCLGPAAYAILVAGGLMALALLAWRNRAMLVRRVRPRRFRRIWPAAYLALWATVTIGGALHPPTNIDALTYRFPRVLHWLEAGRWHWIDTQHLRMNYSAVASDWMAAPGIALTGSVRWLFLANVLCFLLLPGLTFVVLRGFGAGGRAAWRWMWLTPAALVFALQAGSVGNDLAGAVYFLSALAFAFRAGAGGGVAWGFLSGIALGLSTNVKASTLALVPMGLAVWWKTRARAPRQIRGLALATTAVLALAVSAVPTLILNARHSGHWSGDPDNVTRVRPGSVSAALAGNTVLVVAQNLAPPFFPYVSRWNTWAEREFLPWWRAQFSAGSFPRLTLRLAELPREEWAGLGLPLVALLLLEWTIGRRRETPLRPDMRVALGAGAAGIAVFMVTMGSEMPARLLAPFYFVPIIAVATTASRERLSGLPVWRLMAAGAIATAWGSLVLAPARPLFPAAAVWRWARGSWPESAGFERAARVYQVYAARHDMLAPVRAGLRADETVVGFLATDDDSEWSLWQPRGARRVVHISGLDDPKLSPLRVLVVRADVFWRDARAAEDALRAAGFQVAARHDIIVKASRGSERWLVARRVNEAQSARRVATRSRYR